MSIESQSALTKFLAALEAHHAALEERRGEDDPAIDRVYDLVAHTFEQYEEALVRAYGEHLPLMIDDEIDDDDDGYEEYDDALDEDRVPDEAFADEDSDEDDED